MINGSTLTARCGYADFICGSVNVFLKFDIYRPLIRDRILRYCIKASKDIVDCIVIIWLVIGRWMPFKGDGLEKYWTVPFFLCCNILKCNRMRLIIGDDEMEMAAIAGKFGDSRACLFRFSIFMPYASSGVISTCESN